MKKWHILVIIVVIILIIIGGLYLFLNMHDSKIIGFNSAGHVTKITYSHYGNPDNKIAIITGMHPRESLHDSVLPEVAKLYAIFNNVEIVIYQVTVLDNPTDFTISRNNGETLAHDFVVKDISKEDFDLVIIGHDHEEGYGEGFYIATPSMDNASVLLAEKVMLKLPDFNYYKRNTTKEPKSNSIKRVNNPIVATGTPVFVYEIPEWLSFKEAFVKSYDLIDASFKVLRNK